MDLITITLPSPEVTHQLGQSLGKIIPAGLVLLLQGNLGAGKTTFVQGLGASLGITDAIASPTFALVNEYHEGRVPLYHFDLYRLESSGLDELNLEGYWEGNDEVIPGIVAIEWPERLNFEPESYIEIEFDYSPNDSRTATIIFHNVDPQLQRNLAIVLEALELA